MEVRPADSPGSPTGSDAGQRKEKMDECARKNLFAADSPDSAPLCPEQNQPAGPSGSKGVTLETGPKGPEDTQDMEKDRDKFWIRALSDAFDEAQKQVSEGQLHVVWFQILF